MLIDIQIANKKVLVMGGGKIAERKVKNLLHFRPNITLISKTFTPYLENLQSEGMIHLIEGDLLQNDELFDELIEASLVYAATNNKELNSYVSSKARENKILVCAVDMPDICDFYTPATFQKGSIRIGICTEGKSPLMSKILKNRLKDQLTKEDALQVELQCFAREKTKEHIGDTNQRRDLLYKIYNDEEIRLLLKQDQLDDAKKQAEKLLRID
ncbi:bifunctional precorrin-2 dehydrogenase/sirohydrochlorin ferrochelatase [Thermoproteota archaeon]